MRFQTAVLAGLLCLFTGVASAEITRISPSVIPFASSDSSITIFGSDLLGSESTFVVFDGIYEVEASGSSTQISVFVPIDVSAFEGTHTLEVRSTDVGGTIRTHGPVSFTVETQTGSGPPQLTLPEFVVAEAESPSGATVTYDATATSANGDPVAVNCTPQSGSLFPLGLSVVNCSATDSNGTSTGGFSVLVTDTTPPVLTLPADIETDNPVVTFTATAVDNLDGSVPVTCSPASGSTFPTGTTTVRCTALDSHFNITTGTFLVRVTSGPPVVIVPDDMFVPATSASGAVVTFEVVVEEGPAATCTPASGSTFPIGDTTVSCSSTNSFGTTTRTFHVLVADVTGPEMDLPTILEVEATSPAGAIATFTITANDAVDGSRPVVCTPESGTFFAYGTTTVFCSSSDLSGNQTEGTFDVVVADTTAPTFTTATANPAALWPPNHDMVPITLTVTATDALDPAPVIQIVSVESNQPINGTGDGDVAPDWEITGPLTLNLRAERAGSEDRIYTITVSATDLYGNVATTTIQVKVTQSSKSPASIRR